MHRNVYFLVMGGLFWGPAALSFAQSQASVGRDRRAIDLTIYNQDLSLIREERTIDIGKGLSRVVIPDIPATIDGTSLHFASLTEPSTVRVLEQSYEYDMVNQARLLEKYIGKNVEFVRLNEETKKEYSVSGRLLAAGFAGSKNGIVAEIAGKIELAPDGRMILPALPEGLILQPQLEWLVENSKGGPQTAEISYLAAQLSWKADYVLILDQPETKLNLTGWVTLTNNCGTSFRDAGLRLVAGDVNIVRDRLNRGILMRDGMQESKVAQPQFTQTELFEYKMYTLQRHTSLNNNETKQIELVNGKNVSSKKIFIYDGLSDQWRSWYHDYSYRDQASFGQQSNTKVGTYITFKNDARSGMGIPLPKGRVRVYKRDSDNKEQFIGEDEIDHSPKDEEVRLYLGNAFDIVGERSQADFRTFKAEHVIEETIRISLRNHKTEPVEVQVYEHPWRWSQWEVVKASDEYVKIDESTLRFPVKIEKDREKTLTYSLRYKW